MSSRAAFVLGMFVVLAALVHGGVYSAGHDFVVNRFTGEFQFVPADEEVQDETQIHASRSLTAHRPGARFDRLVRGEGGRRTIRVGR